MSSIGLTFLVLVISGAAALPSNAYGDEAVKPSLSSCATIRCKAGFHCEENNGQASCVTDQPEQAATCETLVCSPTAKCFEENGQATCVPSISGVQPTMGTEESGYGSIALGASGISCANIRCRAGYHCEDTGHKASCVQDQPEPATMCASFFCDPDKRCTELNGVPTCILIDPGHTHPPTGTMCADFFCDPDKRCTELNGVPTCVLIDPGHTHPPMDVEDSGYGDGGATTHHPFTMYTIFPVASLIGSIEFEEPHRRQDKGKAQNAYGDEPAIEVCGPHEVKDKCGNPCEPTCQNRTPICTQFCRHDVIVCHCDNDNGWIRDEYTGRCILRLQCPIPSPPIQNLGPAPIVIGSSSSEDEAHHIHA